jgi:DTW domain-containing protein YfiP
LRHIVLHAAARCPGCQLRPRWCICAGQQEVSLDLDVDLLVHFREQHRPSSTGNLIKRVVPSARQHVWRRERKMTAADIQRPGRELWILHPRGEPVPANVAPSSVQILLLDGSWREAAVMADEIASWGRTISLPAIGESRYWLRHQADDRRYSTIEALMVLVQAFGLDDAHEKLRRQFELHVYASLRARGQKELATKYLEESPVPAAFPELLAWLNERRTNEPA